MTLMCFIFQNFKFHFFILGICDNHTTFTVIHSKFTKLLFEYIFFQLMEEEQQIYEQEQVVWAKIRGYPWWPAYVSQLHQNSSKEIQYTVVFFGDNTNSRLDGSKLRKFAENYIQCYSKAKTHRKLMMSIMMAEDKLRQNDQNTQMFEQMRNRIKNKRGKRPLKDAVQSSQHMSQQGSFKNKKKSVQNQIYQQPEENQRQPPKKEVKSKQKTVKQKNSQTKKGKKKVEMNQQSIEEQAVQSQMKQQNEEIDIQMLKKQKKEKHQLYMKKASVSCRTYDISIQVKNGETIERKLSQNVIKQEQKLKERLDEIKQEEISKKEEEIVKFVQNNMQQEPKEKKEEKNRKKTRQKSTATIIPVESAVVQQKNNQTIKNITQLKDTKKTKEITLPSLQKHPTQPLPAKQQSQMQEQVSQQMHNQDSQSLQSDFVKTKKRFRSVSSGQNVNAMNRPIIFPRKRGRPKKIDVIRQLDQDNDSQKQDKNQNIPNFKKKPIHKMPISRQLQRPKEKSLADQAVINGVKKLLNNRKSLIEFLLQSPINVDNIKEILDMDVSNILQQGVVNDQVMHLLQLFRAALLYKFFPDDVKHRKKYEKLIKKKNIQPQRQQMEEKAQELPQIRKKTISKLKKFLIAANQQQINVVQLAQKIEQLIYQHDQDVGSRYCRVAFQALSALKQKRQKYQGIIQKLQSKFYE